MSASRALRHWLLAVNTATGVFLGGALAAPLLAAAGWQAAADALYAAYHLTCHQWAFRTFFVFGQQPVYTEQGLADLGNDPFRFVGDQDLGWKIAICERDLAIYAGLLLVGLVYARQRHLQANAASQPSLAIAQVVDGWRNLKSLAKVTGSGNLPVPADAVGPSTPNPPTQSADSATLRPLGYTTYGLLILPLAVDGLTQLFGWRESTWELRVLTGLLFGLASGWLVLPRLDSAFGLRPAAARYAPDAVCDRLSHASRRG